MRPAELAALLAGVLLSSAAGPVLAQRPGGYTLADVQRHATADNCWMLVDASVYVLTDYLTEHQGEPRDLAEWCGKDATDLFARPNRELRRTLNAIVPYRIGGLAEPPEPPQDDG